MEDQRQVLAGMVDEGGQPETSPRPINDGNGLRRVAAPEAADRSFTRHPHGNGPTPEEA